MVDFSRGEIIYTSKFPEAIKCKSCRNFFTPFESHCKCGEINNISSIVGKIRPVLLWIEKCNWFESMAFAIPLSTTGIFENEYNEPIYLTDYTFIHSNHQYHKPMRAMIHQSTRIDGNVLRKNEIIGRISNEIKIRKIEDKLLNWIFKST